MIAHPIYSSTARLLAVLAMGLASVVLFAGAAKQANADSSQWVISQPESWSGWHMQPWNWNMPQGDMQHTNMQHANMQNSNTQNWSMQHSNMQNGDFRHGGGDFHHDGEDFHHHGDDHHEHFNNGFVIINLNPFVFNQGFVTPAFLGFPPPFIVTQPGFIIGQPFVPGQPHVFFDPRFANKTEDFVERHPSLGTPIVTVTSGHRMHFSRMHSSATVIRSGMHSGMH